MKKTALEAYDHQGRPVRGRRGGPGHRAQPRPFARLPDDVRPPGGADPTGRHSRWSRGVPGRLRAELHQVRPDARSAGVPDGLVGTVEYNPDLYDRETVRRFIGHYTRLLAAVTDDPALPVSPARHDRR
ncbi:hypothetical protein LV779_14880 [Streptomyces thinghirensis]|nr:hypothetical protein [Streptomyces thinghirensis]